MPEDLDLLAKKYGVALTYKDARGDTVCTDLHLVSKLLQNMGVLSDSGEELKPTGNETALPRVQVVRPEKNGTVAVEVMNEPTEGRIEWILRLENGEVRRGITEIIRRSRFDGKASSLLQLSSIDFGYHNLELPELNTSVSLIVTPGHCYLPKNLQEPRRAWGISLQLYLLRSERNWGIGDFSDLAQIAKLAAGWGCEVLGLNPLHQMFLDKPEHASPYSPASRGFLNILYIDVESIPEFQSSEACELARSREFKDALGDCRTSPQLDYETVARLKLKALRLVFDRFRSDASGARQGEFAAFENEGGDTLLNSSLFQSLRDHFSLIDPAQDSWLNWPEQFRSPTSPEVNQFRQEHETEIQFYSWLQWIADQQLWAASQAAKAAGMQIGLYRDLAVGCDRTGCEPWSHSAAFMSSAQVGAPPDILNPSGQNWGLPPFNPVALKRLAYKPFIDLVRANMRHAGGLRIDHVMGLQRLYCIPEGSPAPDGAYIEYPIDDLIGILALESHRNRCLVVGEDLGTVPAGFRQKMADARILSYRVLFFEQDEDNGLVAPDKYPPLAVAVAGSHDLPTVRGWLVEADVDLKQRLGLYPSDEEVALQRSLRRRERAALLKELDLPSSVSEEQFSIAIHRFLGRTKSVLALAQLDDLLCEQAPVNVPATSTEHANWRRRYSLDLGNIFENQITQRLIEAVRESRSSSGRVIAEND